MSDRRAQDALADEFGFIERPSYTELIETFGEVIVETNWGEYDGDSLYLLKAEQGYGILTFGWGSCSGCDSLEACDSQADFDALQDDLERSARWFPTLSEAVGSLRSGVLDDSYLDDEMISAFLEAVAKAEESNDD